MAACKRTSPACRERRAKACSSQPLTNPEPGRSLAPQSRKQLSSCPRKRASSAPLAHEWGIGKRQRHPCQRRDWTPACAGVTRTNGASCRKCLHQNRNRSKSPHALHWPCAGAARAGKTFPEQTPSANQHAHNAKARPRRFPANPPNFTNQDKLQTIPIMPKQAVFISF